MTIARLTGTSTAEWNFETSKAATWPGSITANSLAVLSVTAYTGGGITIGTPAGFTSQLNQTYNNNTLAIFTKECAGSESGTFNVVLSAASYGAFVFDVYDASGDVTFTSASTADTGTSSDATAPSVSGTSGQMLLLAYGLGDPPGTTNSNPSGATIAQSSAFTTNSIRSYYEALASTGATGSKTWDFTNSRDWLGTAMLLSEAGGGGSPTTTDITGSATAKTGLAQTYTFKLDASPAGTVTVTPTAPVAGSWSPTTVGLTSGNWNTGLTSNFTASATGSGNVSSTNDGGLANDTLAVTVHPVSRPSAVTPGTWTDEAGGTLVVADINDGSDATGALDAAGAEYTALPFTLDTVMATGSQTVYFRGKEFYSGKQVRLVLFANDGTTVVATGAWHTMTTTLTTYSEVLTLTAAAYKGELQKQVDPPPVTGLIFPNNNATDSDIRIKWTGSNLFTYNNNTAIWEVEHTVQLGYYAVSWLVSHDDSTWHGSTNNRQRGAHPWPGDGTYDSSGAGLNGSGPTGVDQWFEIAGLTGPLDFISNPSSLTQGSLQLAYNTRYKQAVKSEIVTVSTSNDTLRHTFWPNLADTTFYIQQDQLVSSLDATSTPAFYFGASAWTASGTTNPEALGGMIRNMCLFDAALSIADIVSEANHVQNEAVTTAGIASVWYINRNPTPTDISDKQTQRTTHSPSWATASRPTLYTG